MSEMVRVGPATAAAVSVLFCTRANVFYLTRTVSGQFSPSISQEHEDESALSTDLSAGALQTPSQYVYRCCAAIKQQFAPKAS